MALTRIFHRLRTQSSGHGEPSAAKPQPKETSRPRIQNSGGLRLRKTSDRRILNRITLRNANFTEGRGRRSFRTVHRVRTQSTQSSSHLKYIAVKDEARTTCVPLFTSVQNRGRELLSENSRS